MLWIYVGALILGGGMVLMSLAGGHGHGHDHELHAGGHDVHAGHGLHGGHGGHAHDGDRGGARDAFALLLSMRFWTFLLAFGGLTGTALTLAGIPAVVTGAAAGGTGFSLGLVAALVFRSLATNEVSSAMTSEDWVGRIGRVRIPVSAAHHGKVRLEIDGEIHELVATTTQGDLGVDDEVIVVEVSGDGVALVERNVPGRVASSDAKPIART